MMTTRPLGLLCAALAGAALTTPLLAAPQAPAAAGSCPASPAWVTAPSLPSFATPPTNHCAFYQIAWQSFLYLTSPKAGPGSPAVFETYPTTDEVFGGGSLAKAPQGLKLVTTIDPRTRRQRVLRPRIAKPAPKRSAS